MHVHAIMAVLLLTSVLERENETWWKGRSESSGEVGMFPVTYTDGAPPPVA